MLGDEKPQSGKRMLGWSASKIAARKAGRLKAGRSREWGCCKNSKRARGRRQWFIV